MSHTAGSEHIPHHGPQKRSITWASDTSYNNGLEHVPLRLVRDRRHLPVRLSRGTVLRPRDVELPPVRRLPLPQSRLLRPCVIGAQPPGRGSRPALPPSVLAVFGARLVLVGSGSTPLPATRRDPGSDALRGPRAEAIDRIHALRREGVCTLVVGLPSRACGSEQEQYEGTAFVHLSI